MLDAVKAEYIRRGSPMSYTGWDIPSVRKFMTARMNRLKKGEEVGVYAKDLPKRRSPHNPAPLPSWALSESEDEPEAEEEESEEEEDDGLTDSGYAVQKAKNKYYLVHRASRQKVVLVIQSLDKSGKLPLREELSTWGKAIQRFGMRLHAVSTWVSSCRKPALRKSLRRMRRPGMQ